MIELEAESARSRPPSLRSSALISSTLLCEPNDETGPLRPCRRCSDRAPESGDRTHLALRTLFAPIIVFNEHAPTCRHRRAGDHFPGRCLLRHDELDSRRPSPLESVAFRPDADVPPLSGAPGPWGLLKTGDTFTMSVRTARSPVGGLTTTAARRTFHRVRQD